MISLYHSKQIIMEKRVIEEKSQVEGAKWKGVVTGERGHSKGKRGHLHSLVQGSHRPGTSSEPTF